MAPLKIVFMGTADLACASLKALCQEKSFQVLAAVSQPDKPKGRDLKIPFTPVKAVALAESLPVLQPARARDPGFIEELMKLQPDLIVVAAYGQILPPSILELPPHGCINVHTSLLPKYRGAAPIQWAILEDQMETGVTIMKMDVGMDTGPILTQVTTPISPTDTGQTLHDRLAILGARLLVTTLPEYVGGRIVPRPQPLEGMSHARKIKKEDGQLDWRQPARVLWNRVRAFHPWPGAFTLLPGPGKASLLKIWAVEVEPASQGQPGSVLRSDRESLVVACGQQSLRILELQREGGRRLSVREFLAGHPLLVGTVLGGS